MHHYCSPIYWKKLSPATLEKLHAAFDSFDIDRSASIDMEEAIRHWSVDKNSFGKVSAQEFFKAVDMNGDGEIEFEEFNAYWRVVRAAGHSEAAICEELVRITNRESWVGFSNLPSQYNKVTKHNQSKKPEAKKEEQSGPAEQQQEPADEPKKSGGVRFAD